MYYSQPSYGSEIVVTQTTHARLVIGEYRLRGANGDNTRLTLELFDDSDYAQIARFTANNEHARAIMTSGAVVAEINSDGKATRIFFAESAYDVTTLAEMSNE